MFTRLALLWHSGAARRSSHEPSSSLQAAPASLARSMGDDRSIGVDDTVAATTGSGTAPMDETPPVEALGGRYVIMSLLGSGGMGCVYLARDRELDELVALKMLRRELVASSEMLARFRLEVKLARRVTHRNVARTFDIGDHRDEKFLTMEYVEGESLTSRLARGGALPPAEVQRIGGQLCDGLGAAHAAGVIHRDLMPDNVLLGRDGRVVITDFGIARTSLTAGATQGLIGTPAYMAPEQVEAKGQLDHRADLYALGELLYEMATGVRVWPGESPYAVAAARLIEAPKDPRTLVPALPAGFAELVLRCLSRAPDGRPASAAEVASELSALDDAPPAAQCPILAPAPCRSRMVVAVLPFRNGGSPDDEYIADGLTEDLIDALSMTDGLSVCARGMVMPLKGRDRDPRELGRELGVNAVVECTVRKTGDSIRVSARVASVVDGLQLWAKRFDRPASDVLVVSDELARAIAAALTVTLKAPGREAPTDPVAVDLYLRARQELRGFWQENVARAIPLLEDAMRRAPNDPAILSAYASAQARAVFFDLPDAASLGREAALRAIALAPNLGEPWIAKATLEYREDDAPAALRSLRAALARAPGSAPAHEVAGRILLETGLVDEALRLLQRSLVLDPTASGARWEIARAHALLGSWDAYDKVMAPLDVSPSGIGAWRSARTDAWRRLATDEPLEVNLDLTGLDPRTLAPIQRAMVRHRSLPDTHRAFVRALASAAEPGTRRRALFFQVFAEVTAFVGDKDAAMDGVQEAVRAGLCDVAWMDLCPSLADVRALPAFVDAREIVMSRAALTIAAWRAPFDATMGAGARG